MDLQGQTAVITGASTGIGAVFARELAARGADVVLVARSTHRLQKVAEEITARHPVRAEVVAVDLCDPGAVDVVAERVAVAGGRVDLLVNNAGFGTHGDLAAADPVRLADLVRLNCVAVVALTARFLPAMVAHGHGAVVNVASTAAFQPLPHMAVYGASKAFVLSFSEALWAEVRPAGVRVLALCPGATETPFFDVVGTRDGVVGAVRTPEQVVAAALRALERGRPVAIDGRRNALLARGGRLLPRRMLVRIAERTMRPTPART
ncbi:SDR family NAD(P)-dependent oxidoreductase [Candidatus Frankia alpina]|uniref:SDR family NAD(P)-dependent oxidoreductase n=1 Tax=Candidatus Frankia alpina TaxID=2699483 RepID=UPI0013D3B2ED|nr:SDR family oxidoreductase [Candidatus Frankia alpina]